MKEKIIEWMLVDLDKVRALKLLENRSVIKNPDNKTGFVKISRRELLAKDCLVWLYPDSGWLCVHCHRHHRQIVSWVCPFQDGVNCYDAGYFIQHPDVKRRQ